MFRMSLEQKFYIKFMVDYLKYTSNQIQQHGSMKRSDGTKYRLSTIKFWMERSKTNELNLKSKPGRPALLNKDQVNNLIKLVEKEPKSRYNNIRQQYLRKYGLNIHRRTVNCSFFYLFLKQKFFINYKTFKKSRCYQSSQTTIFDSSAQTRSY